MAGGARLAAFGSERSCPLAHKKRSRSKTTWLQSTARGIECAEQQFCAAPRQHAQNLQRLPCWSVEKFALDGSSPVLRRAATRTPSASGSTPTQTALIPIPTASARHRDRLRCRDRLLDKSYCDTRGVHHLAYRTVRNPGSEDLRYHGATTPLPRHHRRLWSRYYRRSTAPRARRSGLQWTRALRLARQERRFGLTARPLSAERCLAALSFCLMASAPAAAAPAAAKEVVEVVDPKILALQAEVRDATRGALLNKPQALECCARMRVQQPR